MAAGECNIESGIFYLVLRDESGNDTDMSRKIKVIQGDLNDRDMSREIKITQGGRNDTDMSREIKIIQDDRNDTVEQENKVYTE